MDNHKNTMIRPFKEPDIEEWKLKAIERSRQDLLRRIREERRKPLQVFIESMKNGNPHQEDPQS